MPMPSSKLIPASAASPSSNHHVHPDHGLPVEVVGVEAVDVVLDGVVVEVVLDGVVVVVVLPEVAAGLPAVAVGLAGVIVKGRVIVAVAVPVVPTVLSRLVSEGQYCLTKAMKLATCSVILPVMLPLPPLSVPVNPLIVCGREQFVMEIGEVRLITISAVKVMFDIAPFDGLK